MKLGYSVLFSNKGLSENYVEMSTLSLHSFFWVNPDIPFYLFLLGDTSKLSISNLLKEFPYLRVINIEEESLPEGFWSMNISPHGLRYSPVVRGRLPEGATVGYFDLDILHVNKWDSSIQKDLIYIAEDTVVYSTNLSFYEEMLKFFGGKKSIPYFNTGVFYFLNAGEKVPKFLDEVWEECLAAEKQYPQGLAPWFDQHLFNKVAERYKNLCCLLPIGHNFPSSFKMETNNDTRSTVIGTLRTMLEAASPENYRYHFFSTLGTYRYPTMFHIACHFFGNGKVMGKLPKRKLQVVVTDSPYSRVDFFRDTLPFLRKSIGSTPIAYVTEKKYLPSQIEGTNVILAPQEVGVSSKEKALSLLEENVDTLFLLDDEILVNWDTQQHTEAMELYDICNLRLAYGYDLRGMSVWGSTFKNNFNVWTEGLSPYINNKVTPNGLLVKGTILTRIKKKIGWVFLQEQVGDSDFDGTVLGCLVGVLGGYAGFFPVNTMLSHTITKGIRSIIRDPRENTLKMILESLQEKSGINSFWSRNDKAGQLSEVLFRHFKVIHSEQEPLKTPLCAPIALKYDPRVLGEIKGRLKR